MRAKSGRFAFPGCFFFLHCLNVDDTHTHTHTETDRANNKNKRQADRHTHRDFHIFGSCFHLSGEGREEEEEEEEWHWSSAGRIWFPENIRFPVRARCSVSTNTQKTTWLLTVKERIEEKNVPSSYLESLERTPSKTAANCREEGNFSSAQFCLWMSR